MRLLLAAVINRAIWLVKRYPTLHAILRTIAGRPVTRIARFARNNAGVTYKSWIARNETLDEADRASIRADIATWQDPPLLSVIMPVYETTESALAEAIASVRRQLYEHWELCIADDASPSSHVAAMLAALAAEEPRIRWMRRDVNGNISAASNSALALARGEWVVLMDHDDLLSETALYRIAREVVDHPDVAIIYSDEDKIDSNGKRYDPYFKADFDQDLFLVQNLINHLGAYRRDLVQQIEGFREGFEGSQDHDLALRALALVGPSKVRHIPAILYHWRQEADRPSFSEAHLERCISASRRAISEVLLAEGRGATVGANPLIADYHRILQPLPAPAPLVSVIVPTRDRHELLDACLEGVLHRTDYPAIEVIIVDNDSSQPQTFALFEKISKDSRVRIMHIPGEFNYSRLNNLAAAQAGGEILLLLNNDIEVIESDWLRELVSHAVRPGIGAVGAKLLYPDDTIQHAGVVLGIGWPGGVAGHVYHRARRDDPSPFGQLAIVRETAAVTGACLAVRRSLFEQVGGLDEGNLKVAFNDVDFCLRLHAAGLRNIWTPFAVLYHKESASRGDDLTGEKAKRFRREAEYMRERWGALLDNDPFWNPNLSLVTSRRELAEEPRGQPSRPWRLAQRP